MVTNLINKDIELFRKRYDEALLMQGVPCQYQYPNVVGYNTDGEPIVDTFSEPVDTHVFFDGNPKVTTFKRLGWVVENSKDLPFLIHCSFNLPKLQRNCLFRISGQYSMVPERVFRVTELTYDLQAPDHIVCQIVPVYDESKAAGRTDKEVEKEFSTSNHFLSSNTDYRGNYHTTKED